EEMVKEALKDLATDGISMVTKIGNLKGYARVVNKGTKLAREAVKLLKGQKLQKVAGKTTKATKQNTMPTGEKAPKVGRKGKQEKLRKLMKDPKVSSADRSWLKQEHNQVKRKKRANMRVPKGKELAHKRGFEASKGFDYSHSVL